MNNKRPFILKAVLVVAGLVTLSNALEFAALPVLRDRPAVELTVSGVISVIMAALSIWLIVKVLRTQLHRKLWISLYLWLVLLIYPISRGLASAGFNISGPEIPDEQLFGAAIAELLRYVVLIVCIVWVGVSRKLNTYLSGTSSDA